MSGAGVGLAVEGEEGESELGLDWLGVDVGGLRLFGDGGELGF